MSIGGKPVLSFQMRLGWSRSELRHRTSRGATASGPASGGLVETLPGRVGLRPAEVQQAAPSHRLRPAFARVRRPADRQGVPATAPLTGRHRTNPSHGMMSAVSGGGYGGRSERLTNVVAVTREGGRNGMNSQAPSFVPPSAALRRAGRTRPAHLRCGRAVVGCTVVGVGGDHAQRESRSASRRAEPRFHSPFGCSAVPLGKGTRAAARGPDYNGRPLSVPVLRLSIATIASTSASESGRRLSGGTK